MSKNEITQFKYLDVEESNNAEKKSHSESKRYNHNVVGRGESRRLRTKDTLEGGKRSLSRKWKQRRERREKKVCITSIPEDDEEVVVSPLPRSTSPMARVSNCESKRPSSSWSMAPLYTRFKAVQ
jgi:hypothetical protein